MTYRMPAEWEPHEATWLAWPHQEADWPGKFAPIPWVYTEIVRHLCTSERVRIVVANAVAEADVREKLNHAGLDSDWITFWQMPTDRSWIRDFGPIYVKKGDERIALDWRFNAWAKYDNWQADDAIPSQIAPKQKLKRIEPMRNGKRVVLEGGSIDVNGQGLLLTTEECLLSSEQERNPGFNRTDYESVFAEYLGITQTIWLHRGIVGDDTHGHVDDLARFVAPRKVVTIVETNENDENYAALQENLERLRSFEIDGGKLEVLTLPMPRPVMFDGQRLPASYANFYIANGVVLVPTFNDVNDKVALNTLAGLFPEREVVGIHAVDLVWGLGTLHCLSQQEPR